jgi:hypothetical protein
MSLIAEVLRRKRRAEEDPYESAYGGQTHPADAKLRDIRAAIQSIAEERRIKWTHYQRTLHSYILSCIAPKLYGADWYVHKDRVLDMLGVRNYRVISAYIAARNDGKTYGLAACIAAILYVCADYKLVGIVAAANLDQSCLLLVEVYKAFCAIYNGRGKRRCKFAMKSLKVWAEGKRKSPETRSELRARSGMAAHSRGQQPDFIIMEEAAKISTLAYAKVYLPMLATPPRFMVLISSPAVDTIESAGFMNIILDSQVSCEHTRPSSDGVPAGVQYRVCRRPLQAVRGKQRANMCSYPARPAPAQERPPASRDDPPDLCQGSRDVRGRSAGHRRHRGSPRVPGRPHCTVLCNQGIRWKPRF